MTDYMLGFSRSILVLCQSEIQVDWDMDPSLFQLVVLELVIIQNCSDFFLISGTGAPIHFRQKARSLSITLFGGQTVVRI